MDVKMTLADNDLRKVSGTAEMAESVSVIRYWISGSSNSQAEFRQTSS